MVSQPNPQISDHLHNSTTVWTQPQTEDQRRYYSKHASEKRVFGWITTLLQTAHGAIAFAAWTAIYLWLFQRIPFMIPTAPFLAGGTLVALHILFRTTWQTYWYDRLDDDPNTDSPVYVPIAIIALLISIEYQGARTYLAGQVEAPKEKGTDHISGDYDTTISSIEQIYRNDMAAIDEVFKAKLAPIDRQISAARSRAANADDDNQRLQARSRVAAIQAQRDQVLTEKAAALEKALATATDSRNKATLRRDQAITAIDTHNAAEVARYTADMGSVGTYAWVLSLGLMFLIAILSYRAVRINVRSGIIPLRNYTVLDAHGSIPERIWTALTDAANRQGLRVAVWMHRILSPKNAITSFDGTVVAKPGTYNTPEGFYPTAFQPQEPVHMPKSENQALKEVMAKMVRTRTQLTPEQVSQEVGISMRTNGEYPSLPWQHDPPGKTEAPAGPRQPAGAERYAAAASPDYPTLLARWQSMLQNQLDAYDNAVRSGKPSAAKEIEDYIFNDATSPIVKEGKRLHLVWGVQDAEVVVRHRDRTHWVPLAKLTEKALNTPISTEIDTPADGEDDNLFKYDLNRFKEEVLAERDPTTGKVIGVKYRKADGGWGNIGLSQVRAFRNIYTKYNQKDDPGQRVVEGLDKWNYALSLFDEGREVRDESLHTVIQ